MSPNSTVPGAAVRLQKLLAEGGFGSRRTVEAWIRAGRITVGGRKAKLGDRAQPSDDVRLDGKRLTIKAPDAPHELLLYYKPLGEVTTRADPEGRPTVFERLPSPRRGRWINVGRLDVNTTGLLLLTTDGRLAHRLMHPSGGIEREYLVRVRGRPSAETLGRLLLGVPLEDGPASFGRIEGSDSTYRVVLTEGRNREVRRLWEAVGHEVSRLKRIRYGPVELPEDMKPGETRRGTLKLLDKLAGALPGPPGPAPGGTP